MAAAVVQGEHAIWKRGFGKYRGDYDKKLEWDSYDSVGEVVREGTTTSVAPQAEREYGGIAQGRPELR